MKKVLEIGCCQSCGKWNKDGSCVNPKFPTENEDRRYIEDDSVFLDMCPLEDVVAKSVKKPRLSPLVKVPVIDESPMPVGDSTVADRLRAKMKARGEKISVAVDTTEIRKAIDEGKMSYLDAGKKDKK